MGHKSLIRRNNDAIFCFVPSLQFLRGSRARYLRGQVFSHPNLWRVCLDRECGSRGILRRHSLHVLFSGLGPLVRGVMDCEKGVHHLLGSASRLWSFYFFQCVFVRISEFFTGSLRWSCLLVEIVSVLKQRCAVTSGTWNVSRQTCGVVHIHFWLLHLFFSVRVGFTWDTTWSAWNVFPVLRILIKSTGVCGQTGSISTNKLTS